MTKLYNLKNLKMLIPSVSFQINWKLFPIKVHYFFWHAGLSPIFPYLSPYARQLGFSSVVVGLIYTIMPIVGILTKPALGIIADKFQCQKRLFIICQLVVLLSSVALLCIPQIGYIPSSIKLVSSVGDNLALKMSSGLPINDCNLEQYDEFDNTTIFCKKDPYLLAMIVSLSPTESTFQKGILTLPVNKVFLEDPVSWNNKNRNTSLLCYLEKESKINKIISLPKIEDNEIKEKYWCWLFFMSMLFYWIGLGMVNSIGDAICFILLENEPSKYGEQRLYGALGWGIFSAISGYVTDILSDGSPNTDYQFSFYLSIVLIIIDIGVSTKIQYIQPYGSKNILRDVGGFFLKFQYDVFFLWCVAIGICSGLIWQFLYWLIEDLSLKTDCSLQFYRKTLEGLVQTVETIFGEIPFLFLSGWIFSKLGHIHTMSLVILGFGLRLTLYSLVSNPWWFLPIELLNGIDVGLSFACMASYASSIAPEGTESTVQALVGALNEGLGISLGSFIGGISYKEYGGVNTFRYFAYFALSVATVHIVVQYIIQCTSKQNKK